MKYILITSVLFFVACSKRSSIEYWKDDRTEICYASIGYAFLSNFSFTNVPCDSIPSELLK